MCFFIQNGSVSISYWLVTTSLDFQFFILNIYIYIIKPRLSCDSKNVIYLASCNKCRLHDVGSTARQFKVRFRNHKSSMVTNKKTCEVAVHYNNSPHALNDFSFQCIDQVSATNCTEILDKLLITKEAYWSAQLFSLAPFGLHRSVQKK